MGVLALVHVTFVALTFAGLPGLGGVDVAGLGALTAPAGEEADVGADPVEQTVPEAVTDAPPSPEGASGDDDQPTGDDPSSATAAPTTTAAAPAATTTVPPATTTQPTTTLPGNGPGTAVPSPSSTVPDKGGPPTSHPRDQ